MNRRSMSAFLTIMVLVLLGSSGCGLSHPGFRIVISYPHDLSIVEMPSPGGFISVSTDTDSSSAHIAVTPQLHESITLSDNGTLVLSITPPPVGPDFAGHSVIWGGFTIPWWPTTLGEHLLSVTDHFTDPSMNLNMTLTATSRVCLISSLSHPTAADGVCIRNTLYNIIFEVYPNTRQPSNPNPAPPPPLPASGVTPTPASAADCPSGMYYADVTHQCILIPSPTAGSGGAVSCGKITSSAVCNSTPGCSFDFTAKVCKKK